MPIAFCTIRIQYSGAPGSLIAQVSSVDERQDLVVDARTMNEGDGWAGSGANPWHLDKNTESILFLSDEGTMPARIGLSVTAGGVTYYLTELSLAPGETRAMDIRQLRDMQKPDFKGHVIPRNASDGSVTWIRLDDVPVSGRVMVISRAAGVASSYDCCVCQCPMSDTGQLTVSPAPIDLAPTGGTSASGTATLTECNQYYEYCDVTGSSAWSSGDTSVATVNSSALVTGVAGGSTSINAKYSGTEYYWYQPQGRCVAQSIPCSGSCTCNVQVPYFLSLVATSTYTTCTGGTGCARQLTYRVLDVNNAPIDVAGMQIAEAASGTESGTCTGSFEDSGTWTTDATGTMTSPDYWYWCCSPSSCNATYTFTPSLEARDQRFELSDQIPMDGTAAARPQRPLPCGHRRGRPERQGKRASHKLTPTRQVAHRASTGWAQRSGSSPLRSGTLW